MTDSDPSPGRFADLSIEPRYTSDGDLLGTFYVPVLQRAVAYDRVAGYFSSSAFVSAAAGLARFIHNQGTIRLLVGVQLTEADREALLGRTSVDEVLAQRLVAHIDVGADEIAQQRWQVIAWLVQQKRLTIRVGVPCDSDGVPQTAAQAGHRYFHTKFGVVTDAAGDRLAFDGSINESAAGWQENFESFSVYPSWRPEIWQSYGQRCADDFERLWEGNPIASGSDANRGTWQVLPLPEAARDRLLQMVPEHWTPPVSDPLEPAPLTDQERQRLIDIREAPGTCTGVGLASACIMPWPHQEAIARRIVDTWPRSYLLADEVGLGKTIETGLVLRELLLSGRAETALLLVPASVLIQWQEELAEKFLLDVPRLDGSDLVYADDRRERLRAGANPWRAAPVLLASSHLARRRQQRPYLLDGEGWDLVFVDETHHARRRGARPNDTPNQLLATLLALKEHGQWRALLLASATPMQLHTHDLWDLLSLFGLPPSGISAPSTCSSITKRCSSPSPIASGRSSNRCWSATLPPASPTPPRSALCEATSGRFRSTASPTSTNAPSPKPPAANLTPTQRRTGTCGYGPAPRCATGYFALPVPRFGPTATRGVSPMTPSSPTGR